MILSKNRILTLSDLFLIVFSIAFSYFLTNKTIPDDLISFFLESRFIIVWYLIFELLSISRYNMLRRMWSYCSIGDLKVLIEVVVISALISTSLIFIFSDFEILNTFIVAVMVFTALYSLVRISIRISKDNKMIKSGKRNEMKRTLIVGAGDAASLLISQIKKHPNKDLEIKALVDDNPGKRGLLVQGVPVKGRTADIAKIVIEDQIEQITIAIPSLKGADYQRILKKCLETGIPTNIMPNIEDVMSGKIQTSKFKEIDIEDLLGREPVKFNTDLISYQIKSSTVLVTVAGGSIGSEICRQISSFSPKRLILLGHGENSIYLIERELRSKKLGFEIEAIIADVQDKERIYEIFNEFRPDYVYHAAAHKHVPLMEVSPRESIKNNILGTKNVASAAAKYGVNRFVMISTDKAVNPTSVMGATKRLAEIVVQNFNDKSDTKFVSVRFGNVLGSRGSVVPLFKEQIKNGGPITITDKRMTRYFMTIPEASQLVIQAGSLAEGGEVFVLDMGESVKIIDLARKMLELQGLTEEDIEIVEVGMRPGEKLYEETLSSKELIKEQIFPKIFVGSSIKVSDDIINKFIGEYKNYTDEELRKNIMDIAMLGYEKLEMNHNGTSKQS